VRVATTAAWIIGAVFFMVDLRLAMANHRSSDRTSARVGTQVVVIAVGLFIAVALRATLVAFM